MVKENVLRPKFAPYCAFTYTFGFPKYLSISRVFDPTRFKNNSKWLVLTEKTFFSKFNEVKYLSVWGTLLVL